MMTKNPFIILVLVLCAFSAGATASAQTQTPSTTSTEIPDITPNYALGEVTAIDAGGKRLTVKTKSADVTVLLDESTDYKRVPPGETSLKNAEAITLADVGIGDRVMARGKVAEDRKSVPARQVIVMSKAAIAQKQERDREEWRRRGIAGVVEALNPQAKEITVTTRSPEGPKPVVIPVTDKVKLRRYAPDSVKFSDAKPSSWAELKVGDQLRAKGDKSADGTQFAAEEIVTGDFRTIGGTVTAISAEANEIKINDIETKQPLTIVVSKDSLLKRLAPEFMERMTQRMQGGGPGGSVTPPQGSGPSGAGGSAARPGMGGGFDLQRIIENLPEVKVADLKPGEMVLISSTAGADPSRVTAITLVSGVEPLFSMIQARQGGQSNRPPNLGTINLGIGLP